MSDSYQRNLQTFDLSPLAGSCLARLKQRYGTKKNAVETALFALEAAELTAARPGGTQTATPTRRAGRRHRKGK